MKKIRIPVNKHAKKHTNTYIYMMMKGKNIGVHKTIVSENIQPLKSL